MHSNASTRSYALAWRRVGGVADGKLHAIGHAGVVRIGLGQRDGRRVEVVAVDPHLRVRPRDADARPADATADLGHPCRRICPQTRVHIRDSRQPVPAEQLKERGTVQPALALAHVCAILLERHAGARAEGLQKRRQRLNGANHELHQRRQVIQAVLRHEDLGVPGG